MTPWRNLFVVCISFFVLAGCSAKQDVIVPPPPNQNRTILPPENRELIVLLPDPDGKVGTLHVTNEGGAQTLEKPGYATQVENFTKPPTAPLPLDENEITIVFGPALSIQPDLMDRFISFILYFESDSTKLTYNSQNLPLEIVRSITNRNCNEVYVVGHTDRVGTEVYNLGLSSRRANYIRDQLLSAGIKSSTLVVSFHGETMPRVKTEDEVVEPLNRRVEVIVR